MNFTIHRTPLWEALQKVQAVVERKNTVPILGNILCVVENNILFLSATDLEIGIQVTLPVEMSTNGKVTLSSKHFVEIVKELPDKPLQINKKDNNWVEILCGKAKFNIVSMPAEDYPALPEFSEKVYIDARAESLLDMIHRTQYAVSTDSSRYHLNGVFFEQLENGLSRMTATDGYRLSFVDNEVFLAPPDLKRGVIIPKKGLAEIYRLLSLGGSTVGLSFERGNIFVKHNDSYLFIRLIEGEYPDCRVFLSHTMDKVIRMDRETITSAIKRVSLLANEKSRSIKFSVQPNVLVITSNNPEMGEAREEIDIEYTGDPIETGFNSKYFLDCLMVQKSEKMELQLKDRLNPGIIKGLNEQNHTYVLMPMRV